MSNKAFMTLPSVRNSFEILVYHKRKRERETTQLRSHRTKQNLFPKKGMQPTRVWEESSPGGKCAWVLSLVQ
jgi:hypothetical protein